VAAAFHHSFGVTTPESQMAPVFMYAWCPVIFVEGRMLQFDRLLGIVVRDWSTLMRHENALFAKPGFLTDTEQRSSLNIILTFRRFIYF